MRALIFASATHSGVWSDIRAEKPRSHAHSGVALRRYRRNPAATERCHQRTVL